MTTKYFADRITLITEKFKDCKHDLTRDYSSGDLIHLYCCKCQSHYYDNPEPLCKGKWISAELWERWNNSHADFDGKGYDFWFKNKGGI